VGVAASVKATATSSSPIELRDKNYLLDATIIGDTIATGPNAGKPKPILLGRVRNVDSHAYLFDTGNLEYYINNFPLAASVYAYASSIDVRDSGASLRDGQPFQLRQARRAPL
jgi:hypothetical protein